MLTLFWDERVVILEHYMPRGNTVNSATYADLLKNHLRPAIKFKGRGLLSTCVLLQHDNARPILPVQLLQQSKICPSSVFHTRRTQQTSPPVTLCLWTAQRGDGRQVFQVRQKQAVHEWLRSQPKDLFSRDIHALQSTGTLVWYAMETMYKNEVTAYLLCSINYEIKNI
jgi:hypothetical protein